MDWIVKNEKRNKFIKNIACNTKNNTLLLFQYVDKHGKVLYDTIKKEVGDKRKVFYIHGGVDTEEREEARQIAMKENDCIIVASFATLSTGVNIPNIETVIFASPSKSKIRNLQSIGRGLRLKGDKTSCELIDIADDLSWKSKTNHMLNHAMERMKIYSSEDFDYKIIEVNF
jgi:superfamily II DNA or RNA helicase